MALDTATEMQVSSGEAESTGSTDDSTDASLSSSPPELRLQIYDHISSGEDIWLLINVFDEVMISASGNNGVKDLMTPMMTANRQIHGEVASAVYGRADTTIVVHDNDAGALGSEIGPVENITFLPFLCKVNLDLRFTRRGTSEILLRRLNSLIPALEYGKQLRSLVLRLIWGASEKIPADIDKVIQQLSSFQFEGDLRVIVDGNLDSEETGEMEADIRSKIMGPTNF